MTSVAASLFASPPLSPSANAAPAAAETASPDAGFGSAPDASVPLDPLAGAVLPTLETTRLPSPTVALLTMTSILQEPAASAAPPVTAFAPAPPTETTTRTIGGVEPEPDIFVIQPDAQPSEAPGAAQARAASAPPTPGTSPESTPAPGGTLADQPVTERLTKGGARDIPIDDPVATDSPPVPVKLPPVPPKWPTMPPGLRRPTAQPLISTLQTPLARVGSAEPAALPGGKAATDGKSEDSARPEPAVAAAKEAPVPAILPPAPPIILVAQPPAIAAPPLSTAAVQPPAPEKATRNEKISEAKLAPSSSALDTHSAGAVPTNARFVLPFAQDDRERRSDAGDEPSRPGPAPANGAATDASAGPRYTAAPAPILAGPLPAALHTERNAKAAMASITAQPGRIGQELGVAIARHVASGSAASGGGETITLRLNPVDMGRIDVKLSFDDVSTLRAVVSADNPAALDMLRRDSADLGRALLDAGVRADTQTLRFDTRGDGHRGGQAGESGQPWQRPSDTRFRGMNETGADIAPDTAAYRPLRTRGGVDLMA